MQLAPSVRELRIRFVGSGSEYFRIWIVNQLLTLVTLGIYYPYARLRRLKYFYGHTEVDGRPLDFHAKGSQMVAGYWLAIALLALYSVASALSFEAGVAAAVLVGGLWPLMWRSSLRFRLGNTSWSGLRGGFAGTIGGAYAAFWPWVVPAAAFVLAAQPDERAGQASPWLVGVVVLAGLALLPLGQWQLRRYMHSHMSFGDEHTRFSVGPGAVYGVMLRAGLLAALLVVVLGAASVGLPRLVGQLGMLVVIMVLALLAQAVLRSYIAARMQNLFWNGTRTQRLRPYSQLQARALMKLTLRNWSLVALTLGLYLPFAAVATARLKLESVSLLSKLAPDELLAGQQQTASAAGDAAADAFGMDVGL